MTKSFTFTAPVWLYQMKPKVDAPRKEGAWHFISVPKEITTQIDDFFAHAKRGWGSLKVDVIIGETNWKTSIFPDTKTGTYLLPVKAEVRKKEGIQTNDEVTVELVITD